MAEFDNVRKELDSEISTYEDEKRRMQGEIDSLTVEVEHLRKEAREKENAITATKHPTVVADDGIDDNTYEATIVSEMETRFGGPPAELPTAQDSVRFLIDKLKEQRRAHVVLVDAVRKEMVVAYEQQQQQKKPPVVSPVDSTVAASSCGRIRSLPDMTTCDRDSCMDRSAHLLRLLNENKRLMVELAQLRKTVTNFWF